MGIVMSFGNNEKELRDIRKDIEEVKKLIGARHIRLEALISALLDREMITQDSFYKIFNLLLEYREETRVELRLKEITNG